MTINLFNFLLQVDAGINFPETHPVEYRGTGKRFIKRFPYKVIYFIEEEKIIVIAVLHGNRRPNLLKKD